MVNAATKRNGIKNTSDADTFKLSKKTLNQRVYSTIVTPEIE